MNDILIQKLKEYVENYKNTVALQYKHAQTSELSYLGGEINMLAMVLEWIADLPDEQELDKIIKTIETVHAQDDYKYNGFSYQELKQLQKLYEM
jgi:formylmethanofuran dehydrogenase subunit E-like metal-binding protein